MKLMSHLKKKPAVSYQMHFLFNLNIYACVYIYETVFIHYYSTCKCLLSLCKRIPKSKNGTLT